MRYNTKKENEKNVMERKDSIECINRRRGDEKEKRQNKERKNALAYKHAVTKLLPYCHKFSDYLFM